MDKNPIFFSLKPSLTGKFRLWNDLCNRFLIIAWLYTLNHTTLMYFNNFEIYRQYCLNNNFLDKNGAMVLVAENSKNSIDDLITDFNKNNKKLFGGFFPSLIVNYSQKSEGFIVIPLEVKSVHEFKLEENTNPFDFGDDPESEDCTCVMFTDGMCPNTNRFLRKYIYSLGHDLPLFGAGCGSSSFEKMPCVFTNEGQLQDGGVLGFIKSSCKIGIKHGWNNFVGPLVATSTQDNIIKELNWRPAFDVYKEAIESNSENRFNGKNFLNIASHFPFGIAKDGVEYIVRDPIGVNDKKEIICISEVPENSVIQILNGDGKSILKAASDAAKLVSNSKKDFKNIFIFDCVTRVTFLGEGYSEELKSVISNFKEKEQADVFGAAVMGEIAPNGFGQIELFNKTIIVGGIEE